MRLDGVRILDLTQYLPGPYATQLLSDSGADVIRVEDVAGSDPVRYMGEHTDRGVGKLFDGTNRGKRSVALDLKADRGRSVFFDLVAEADVVFEQFRPGVVDSLGIDYNSVRAVNESIIYCSLTGYGQTGPYADHAGHDLNYVSLAGLVDMTREDPTADPVLPGYPIGDMSGGLFSAFSIATALLSRELGNTNGEYIDVGMSDVVASFSHAVAYEALAGGDPRPGETGLTGHLPWYDVYECADGEFMSIAALEPKFWQAFCETVDRPDLAGVHGSTDAEELAGLRADLTELFATKSRDEWVAELPPESMTAPVLSPAEALEHEQFTSRDVVEREPDVPPRVGFPAVSTDQPAPDQSVPGLGEHTAEVLAELGYDAEEIDSLRADEVIN